MKEGTYGEEGARWTSLEQRGATWRARRAGSDEDRSDEGREGQSRGILGWCCAL